jgi:hypothetical protein
MINEMYVNPEFHPMVLTSTPIRRQQFVQFVLSMIIIAFLLWMFGFTEYIFFNFFLVGVGICSGLTIGYWKTSRIITRLTQKEKLSRDRLDNLINVFGFVVIIGTISLMWLFNIVNQVRLFISLGFVFFWAPSYWGTFNFVGWIILHNFESRTRFEVHIRKGLGANYFLKHKDEADKPRTRFQLFLEAAAEGDSSLIVFYSAPVPEWARMHGNPVDLGAELEERSNWTGPYGSLYQRVKPFLLELLFLARSLRYEVKSSRRRLGWVGIGFTTLLFIVPFPMLSLLGWSSTLFFVYIIGCGCGALLVLVAWVVPEDRLWGKYQEKIFDLKKSYPDVENSLSLIIQQLDRQVLSF